MTCRRVWQLRVQSRIVCLLGRCFRVPYWPLNENRILIDRSFANSKRIVLWVNPLWMCGSFDPILCISQPKGFHYQDDIVSCAVLSTRLKCALMTVEFKPKAVSTNICVFVSQFARFVWTLSLNRYPTERMPKNQRTDYTVQNWMIIISGSVSLKLTHIEGLNM